MTNVTVYCKCGREHDIIQVDKADNFVEVGPCHGCGNELERLQDVSITVKNSFGRWAFLTVIPEPDGSVFYIHPNLLNNDRLQFETLEDLEAWAREFEPGASKEIIHRSFKGVLNATMV